MSARWNENRKITQRIVVKGKLSLLSPARFGNGEGDSVTNMPLLRDPGDGVALLPGTSIAGAMRAYLRERLLGFEKIEPADGSSLPQKLFGDVLEDEEIPENRRQSRESYLSIDDSCAETTTTEFRPGVKIDPATRIAAVAVDKESNVEKGGQLYDMELLEVGTVFPLEIELDLPDDPALQIELKKGLAIALSGFEKGEIGLGARKRRGFGECQVSDWQVQTYNLKDASQLVAWIKGEPGQVAEKGSIAHKLGFDEALPDDRARFCIEAEFKLKTSLLIRSGSGKADAPEMVHLHSRRGKDQKPILSGTSLAGAMRARAVRIANTIIPDPAKAKNLVCEVFGPDDLQKQSERGKENQPFASRVVIREREVQGRDDLVQTRIRIDRFTGGTFPGALFEQQPVIGGSKSKVAVSLELRNPEPAHMGLLLHILKDLWTGDLPLGGESSTGRGRLEGQKADLYRYQPGQEKPDEWHITPGEKGQIQIIGDKEKLDAYAKSVGGAE